MVIGAFSQNTTNSNEHFVTHAQSTNTAGVYCKIKRSMVKVLARVIELSLSHAKDKSKTELNKMCTSWTCYENNWSNHYSEHFIV